MNKTERKAAKIAEALETLQELTHCRVSLTMNKSELNKDSDYHKCQIDTLESIILSQPDFNGKDSRKIVFGFLAFRDFYAALPRCNFGKGNPNTGSALFSVEIPDDATIILRASQTIFKSDKDEKVWFNQKQLEKHAKIYGEAWNADEISVDVTKRQSSDFDATFYDCVIRFWWD